VDLEELYNKVSALDINAEFSKLFRDAGIQEFVLDLNREKQLFAKGIGVDGQVVGYYSLASELISRGESGRGFPKRFNQPYNFLDSGDLFRSFKLLVGNTSFEIVANTDKLEEDFIIESEEQIIGLTNESITELVAHIAPKLAEQVRQKIVG
jgi:hypothetical protein